MASALSIGLLCLCGASMAEEREHDGPKARLYLPIAGTVTRGGTPIGSFAGTLSVQKFSERDGQLVAIGMVSGTLTTSEGTFTSLSGPMQFPVGDPRSVRSASAAAGNAQVTPQQAATCQILHLEVGAITFNVLGLQVTTQPIAIDLSGVSGGTNVLGQLICTILEAVGSIVGLLNTLLGLLGGLTG
jgi:hypothetical protein